MITSKYHKLFCDTVCDTGCDTVFISIRVSSQFERIRQFNHTEDTQQKVVPFVFIQTWKRSFYNTLITSTIGLTHNCLCCEDDMTYMYSRCLGIITSNVSTEKYY